MRKKSVIAIMMALSLSQVAVVSLATNPVMVCAENKVSYFSGSGVSFTSDDLSVSGFPIGLTNESDYRYVVSYKDKYMASEYYSENTSEGEYKSCEFNKVYSNEEDALQVAQSVPKGVNVYINLKALGLSGVSDLAQVSLSVYSETTLKTVISLDKIGTIIEEFKNEPKSDGSVEVTVKSLEKFNNKIKLSWKLKDDYAMSFEILDSNYNISLDEKASGKEEINAELQDGVYKYVFTTTSGRQYKGQFRISNKYKEDNFRKDGVSAKTAKFSGAPKLVVSGIPKSKMVGETFSLKIASNMDALITFNGRNSGSYGRSAKFPVTSNGEFIYTAVNRDGEKTTGKVKIKCFSRTKNGLSRGNYWSSEMKSDDVSKLGVKRLVQTGMYDLRLTLLAVFLGVFGVGTLGYRFFAKRKKGDSNEKVS